jgi:hypothetical protein
MRSTCRPLRRLATAAWLAAAVLLAAGCAKPLAELQKLMVRGYVAVDLLPGDRQVGSWRLAEAAKDLRSSELRTTLGDEAADRARNWDRGRAVGAGYRLGETGRSLLVQVYEMPRPQAAFDVYSTLRARAMTRDGAARLTKVGVQGMLLPGLSGSEAGPEAGAGNETGVLIFWAERFLVRLAARGGTAHEAESALQAFGQAIAAKVDKPFELSEVYVLQVNGQVPDSERYASRRVLGRQELPSGVTAVWRGRSGSGTLFISVLPDARKAQGAFKKLAAASGGTIAPSYADGLFAGELPGLGPVACFRRARAVIGLVGSCEPAERLEVLEEIRRRCAGEEITPALAADAPPPAAAPPPAPENPRR